MGKILKSNYSLECLEKTWNELSLSPQTRAEALTLEDIQNLYKTLKENSSS